MQEKILTSNKALNLLYEGVINHKTDFLKPENRWILHSIYVGIAAKRIAIALNLDSEYAKVLGYIHDIGRKINHNNHPIEGYKYLIKLGYFKEASISLTHSFINNDINITAGGGLKDIDSYKYIEGFLKKTPISPYDNIIQLCDLFCLETGFTTIEKRLLDISLRKGVYDNSYLYYQEVMKLKTKLEDKIGCDLYNLFPEIKEEDKINIINNKETLLNMFKEKFIMKTKI